MRVLFQLISTALVLLITLFASPHALAATYTISPDGSGDFPTIAAAISGAEADDAIELIDGVYTGFGNRDIILNKKLHFRAQAGPSGYCIIDCEADGSDQHFGFDIDDGATGSSFEGITIQHAWESGIGGGAIRMYETSITFSRCIFWLNHSVLRGGAFWATTGSSIELIDCYLAGNATDQGGFGGVICIEDGSSVTASGCIFNDNWGDSGGTIFCQASTVSLFECTINESRGPAVNFAMVGHSGAEYLIDNSIIGFGTGSPVKCYDTSSATLSCSDVFGNADGDWVGSIVGQLGIDGNISSDPLYCWPYGAPFTVYDTSYCAPHISPCGQIGAKSVGCASTPQALEDGQEEHAGSLWLGHPLPNPASACITIRYALTGGYTGTEATLAVYDTNGRLVNSLREGIASSSIGQVDWDRTGKGGSAVPAGVYFVRFSSGDEVVIRSVTVIR